MGRYGETIGIVIIHGSVFGGGALGFYGFILCVQFLKSWKQKEIIEYIDCKMPRNSPLSQMKMRGVLVV